MKQQMAPAIIKSFWELTRCGLWGQTPDPVLFQNMDENGWQQLIYLINKQTVTGICFAAMQKLPENYRPMRSAYLNWYSHVIEIKQRHEHLRQTCSQVFQKFERKGIFPVLLKGIGVASCYPNPSLRITGDIDLYIPEHFHEAVDMVKRSGVEVNHQSNHDKFEYNAISIELHHALLHLPALMTEANSWQDTTTTLVQYDDMEFRVPDPDSNAALLLAHPFKHIFSWGIGVRHLCDWTLFLHRYHEQINHPRVMSYLKKVHLDRFASTFTLLAMEKLGLHHDIAIPWITNPSRLAGWRLEEDLIATGDTGNDVMIYCRTIEARPPSYRNKRLLFRIYCQLLARLIRLYPIAPYYSSRRFMRNVHQYFLKLTSKHT